MRVQVREAEGEKRGPGTIRPRDWWAVGSEGDGRENHPPGQVTCWASLSSILGSSPLSRREITSGLNPGSPAPGKTQELVVGYHGHKEASELGPRPAEEMHTLGAWWLEALMVIASLICWVSITFKTDCGMSSLFKALCYASQVWNTHTMFQRLNVEKNVKWNIPH